MIFQSSETYSMTEFTVRMLKVEEGEVEEEMEEEGAR